MSADQQLRDVAAGLFAAICRLNRELPERGIISPAAAEHIERVLRDAGALQ